MHSNGIGHPRRRCSAQAVEPMKALACCKDPLASVTRCLVEVLRWAPLSKAHRNPRLCKMRRCRTRLGWARCWASGSLPQAAAEIWPPGACHLMAPSLELLGLPAYSKTLSSPTDLIQKCFIWEDSETCNMLLLDSTARSANFISILTTFA